MPRVSEEHFNISYDGPALSGHEMDVADLAPALFALSCALKRAQQVVDPGAPPVSLNVQATQEGSFEVAMLLAQPGGFVDQLTEALTGRPVTASLNATSILGLLWLVVDFLKKAAGRRIAAVKHASSGTVTVTLADGTKLEGVANDVVEVARDLDFRHDLSRVVAPLDREGIDSVQFTVSRTVRASVNKSDLPSLEVPDVPAEQLPDVHRETRVQLVGVEFDWRRWRVTEGAGSMSVAVQDEDFKDKVERGEITLGSQDTLKVDLLTRQERDSKGALKARHAIVRVLEHQPGSRQIPLEGLRDDDLSPGEE